MIVLGINGFSNSAAFFDAQFGSRGIDRHLLTGHDASAAIFRDGVLIAAAEEERFNRVRKSSDFPQQAINYCLESADVSLSDIDQICVPWDCNEQWMTILLADILQGDGALTEKLAMLEKMKQYYFQVVSYQAIMNDFNLRMGTSFTSEKFTFVPHHIAHMMCGFYASGMNASAFLVTDGRGENNSSIMGKIDQHGYEIFDSISIPDSIGTLYRKFTRYLGFTPNSDEYKVMAMGALATSPPDYDMDQFITLLPHGKFNIIIPSEGDNDLPYYRFFASFFGEPNEKTFNNMAYFIQKITETAIWHQVHYIQEKTTCDTLYIEGGVALNCVNNGKILAKSRFKDVHVSFGASDSGVSIGAAFFPFYQKKQFSKYPITPYLGPVYSDAIILAALQEKSNSVVFEQHNEAEMMQHVVKALANKKIIAWFQGKMEFGPRALGNRSILANPQFPDMKDIINAKVKYREAFRPFAGVMQEEKAAGYFDLGKKQSSPYMTFVFDAKASARENLVGALHVDNTSRLQTISQEQNPKLYRLLEQFSVVTGVDCLINTSFNVMGEPIVCSPVDAILCFLHSGIDILVMNNFIVHKK